MESILAGLFQFDKKSKTTHKEHINGKLQSWLLQTPETILTEACNFQIKYDSRRMDTNVTVQNEATHSSSEDEEKKEVHRIKSYSDVQKMKLAK